LPDNYQIVKRGNDRIANSGFRGEKSRGGGGPFYSWIGERKETKSDRGKRKTFPKINGPETEKWSDVCPRGKKGMREGIFLDRKESGMNQRAEK